MAGGILRKRERKVSPRGPGGELAAGGWVGQERGMQGWGLVLRGRQQQCLCPARFCDARHQHQQPHAARRAGSADLQLTLIGAFSN